MPHEEVWDTSLLSPSAKKRIIGLCSQGRNLSWRIQQTLQEEEEISARMKTLVSPSFETLELIVYTEKLRIIRNNLEFKLKTIMTSIEAVYAVAELSDFVRYSHSDFVTTQIQTRFMQM